MRDYLDRRVTLPSWGPPPPCEQALKGNLEIFRSLEQLCVAFTFIAKLWCARRACRAPWVSKSTHPRKFVNHVTVHRPSARPSVRPSAPQSNQCLISHFLASLRAQEDRYCTHQEPITWSLQICCTLESTHSRKELFLQQAFPRN